MTNIITKPEFGPARELIKENWEKVKQARIKIGDGPGSLEHKELCIMQATSYILGYDPGEYEPPCCSDKITQFMIDLNDSGYVSDRKRARLKTVIPDIINTAPTILTVTKKLHMIGKIPTPFVCIEVVTNTYDPDYVKAEYIRQQMIDDLGGKLDRDKNFGKLPMTKLIPFIQELAAVAKFDTENDNTNINKI